MDILKIVEKYINKVNPRVMSLAFMVFRRLKPIPFVKKRIEKEISHRTWEKRRHDHNHS